MQKTANYVRGDRHHKASLNDGEVDLLRRLREIEGWSYKRLASKFGIPKSTVRDMCLYRTRAGATAL